MRVTPAGWLVPTGLALYAALAFRAQLDPGLPLYFDAHSHLARAWFVLQSLRELSYPGWTHLWYGGFHPFELLGPSYYGLVAAVGALVGDVVPATKLVLWLGQVLAVLGLYAFTRQLVPQRLASAAAALLFVHAPQRELVLGQLGNHPNVVLYAALPWLLWALARTRRPLPLFARVSLLLAVALLGHLVNAALLLPGIAAFALAWIPWRQRHLQLAFLCALPAALLLSAFAVLPAWLQLDERMLSLDVAQPPSRGPSLAPLAILTGLTPPSIRHYLVSNHGAALSLLGLATALWLGRRSRGARALGAGLAATLLTVALLEDRAALGVALFLYPLCAAAVAAVAERLPRYRSALAAAALPLLAVLAGGGAPGRPDHTDPEAFAVYRRLPDTPTRSRSFDVTRYTTLLQGFYGPAGFSPYWSGRGVPFGAYPQGAPLRSHVSLSLMGLVLRDLRGRGHPLSDDSLDVLYLSHVALLVDRGSKPRLRRVAGGGAGRALGPRLLLLADASPALFSRRAAPVPELYRGGEEEGLRGEIEELWRRNPLGVHPHHSLDLIWRTGRSRDWEKILPLLRYMQIDRGAARAERLFAERPLPGDADAAEASPGEVPHAGDPAGAPRFRVLRHDEGTGRAEIEARASADGFVRVAYAWDPELRVELDGAPVPSVPGALGGAILMRFPAGRHVIAVRAPRAALPRSLLALSGLASLLLLPVALRAGAHSA